MFRRGIDVVRSKIKMFAQKKLTLPPGRHKIIILDEADSMTGAAQQALRRTMELYSNSTRFALAANQSTKIIEPIQSRCAVLRYSKLSDQQVLMRLMEVCKAEDVRSPPPHTYAHMWNQEEQTAIVACLRVNSGRVQNAMFAHYFAHYRMQVNSSEDGLEAVLFTAEGDMRQAINNLQSTHSGYGLVNRDNVFKVGPMLPPILCGRVLPARRARADKES
jgi:replication factor C subunit 2/4